MGRHSAPTPAPVPVPVPARLRPVDPHGAPALSVLTPTVLDFVEADHTQPIPVQSRHARPAEPAPARHRAAPRETSHIPIQRKIVHSLPLDVTPAPSTMFTAPPVIPPAFPPPRTAPPSFPPGDLTPPSSRPLRGEPAPVPAPPAQPRPARLPRPAPPAPPDQSAPREPAVDQTPRLLLGGTEPADLAEHLRRHGELPRAEFAGRDGAARLVALTDRAGLRGRGGGGFPTARKMAAVLDAATSRRRPVVVANGCEGDPTSRKDQLLLCAAPHLVLDGVALAAHAVGAGQAILCVHRGSPLVEALERAIAERTDDPCDIHVVTAPRRYVASEASALVRFLTEGDARPTSTPPLPSERGVQGRPTLVDNAETLAHLALVARHGADWFRVRGTEHSPGTTLVTVGGAVHRPGVYEVDLGAGAGHLLRLAGGATGPVQAMLLGGLGGSWLRLPAAGNLALSHEACTAAGVGLGVASLLALPADACGLAVTSAVVGYLAGESAGQCGPCMFGLPSVAEDLAALADGRPDKALSDRLSTRLGVIPRRGACAHPDGAVRLAASALEVFAEDVAEHLAGRPCGRPGLAALPALGELSEQQGGWR